MKTKPIKHLLVACLSLLGIATTLRGQEQTNLPKTKVAQNWSCGFDEAEMKRLAADPGFMSRMASFNNAISVFQGSANKAQAAAPYIIPVVFHLISSNGVTPSYTQVKWQLARINAAFQNQMNLFNGEANGARAVNTQIEFRLACIAQNSVNAWTSNSEPGVMRYHNVGSTITNQGVLTPATYNPMLVMTHSTPATFPFNNYLNIWCVPSIGGGSVIGYGTFPWLGAGIDGIVMDIDDIGNNSYPSNFPLIGQLDKGAVLAHEIGHYLGLYHTFETLTLGCTTSPVFNAIGCWGTTPASGACEGDLVLDTPPTNIIADLGAQTSINSCHETNSPYGGLNQDEPDQLENYMSYSDDDKLNTFTQGQANRMTSFLNTLGGIRYNLNLTANLLATGVSPNSCANQTGLLTALFNYSITPSNNCSNVGVQFIVPSSLGFVTSGTTYNWTFGDGTTGTGMNVNHIYAATTSNFNVTLVVTNGASSQSFSQIITIPTGQTSIVNQSGGGISVCKGAEQTIFVRFQNNVPSAQITDGTNIYTVNNNYFPWNFPSTTATQDVPFTLPLNSVGVVTFNMLPAVCNGVNLGSVTFTVTECCNNLVTNGDLEAGNTGFYTDHCMPASNALNNPGSSAVNIPLYSLYNLNVPYSGNILGVDGCSTSNNATCLNTTNTVPNPCANIGVKKIIFGQQLSGLKGGSKYYISFKSTEHILANSTYPCSPLTFGVKLYNLSSGTLIQQNNLVAPMINDPWALNGKLINWNVYDFNFPTPTSLLPTDQYFLEIYQMDYFDGGAFDYGIDNIILSELVPSIQAVGTASICPGQSTTLCAVANCGNSLSNYNYVWSPNVGLNSNTVMCPVASPTATTIYTLVAIPTTTVGGLPAIISMVTITVRPTFTVTPPYTIIYSGQSVVLTANGNAGPYVWNPGALTGNSITVSPLANTVYTATSLLTGSCVVANTATVIVSTACSQESSASYGTSTVSVTNFVPGTYSIANSVIDMQGTIIFTGNTSFIGYTLRMKPGTKLVVNGGVTLTLDNCKLFGCTELWYGIELVTANNNNANISVRSTSIEDMYYGIYRYIPYAAGGSATQGFINISGSTFNKNYYGVQLLNLKAPIPVGTTYALTVTGTKFTSLPSLTSPGYTLKSSSIPSYVYAYNNIVGGTNALTSPYINFPRSFTGINLINLSASSNVLIGDSVATNQFNTFSNLDIGINANNSHLRAHNNYFYYMKGSAKQVASILQQIGDPPLPVPAGPDNIGAAIISDHTIAKTYSLQVGTSNSAVPVASLVYPKANIFKACGKGIISKNCNLVIAKGNWFDADTTDVPLGFAINSYPNTYYYYRAQNAIWISGLSQNATLSSNIMRNYSAGIYCNYTMASSVGAITIRSNSIASNIGTGYCKQAIQIDQTGGGNISSNLLEVYSNSFSGIYNGIKVSTVLDGLYAHNNTLNIDGIKTLGITATSLRKGFELQGCQKGIVSVNSVQGSAVITPSNFSYFTAFYTQNSANGKITCNTANNMGRGFLFFGPCTNAWLGNSISNSYQGLILVANGVIGTQGTSAGTPQAANTWNNVTQETYVSGTTNANTNSIMYVAANVPGPKTSPTLNFGTAGQLYSTGIQNVLGTAFSCGVPPPNAKISKAENDNLPTELMSDFILYPNPNNGNMSLSYNIGSGSKASMNLFDVTGKLVNSYDLQNNVGILEINEGHLQNGIYFYNILINDIVVKTNKMVIIK